MSSCLFCTWSALLVGRVVKDIGYANVVLLLVGRVGRAGLWCKRLDRLGASLALTPYPGHEEADKEVQIRRCRSKMWSFPEAVGMVGSWVDALIEEAARAPFRGVGVSEAGGGRGRGSLLRGVRRRWGRGEWWWNRGAAYPRPTSRALFSLDGGE